ncbi:(2Fe-2S)-binding protein [Parasporobacterium paucivorans]|uniref:Carbon-monoxide dehydrogenase small subunit n=1 Tax=Parasporobacterium paucivorans DSM 15970 TaxID=1122934 RepID=A0A1M6C5Q9_9FIRM|nr:(2Fe-2S)-binding protein [Parasporobacterium paucivorans]SHI56360.1 carbon-monoxide dehydrogenase small subunit [Parasporobacterium paucivorans DSM 15970]
MIEFELNGKKVKSERPASHRLLDVLREEFRLTGVKCGCGEGECGACSVFMNGELVNSCILSMGRIRGQSIITIEGFRETKRFAVLQDAYDKTGAVQCGFCTPGMIMASEALLSRVPDPQEEEIRDALSGNLCRCTGYNMIVDAVLLAAKEGKGIW